MWFRLPYDNHKFTSRGMLFKPALDFGDRTPLHFLKLFRQFPRDGDPPVVEDRFKFMEQFHQPMG
jgi:hypothetical protein